MQYNIRGTIVSKTKSVVWTGFGNSKKTKDAFKLLKQKPAIPKSLVHTDYRDWISSSRRSLKKHTKSMYVTETYTLVYPKPKHYDFLQKQARRSGNPTIELTSSLTIDAMENAIPLILKKIKERREALAAARTTSRDVFRYNSNTRYVNGNSVHLDGLVYVHAGTKMFGAQFNSPMVFLESGAILKLAAARRSRRVLQPKKPRTNERHIGIEIEFACKLGQSDLAIAFTDAGVQEYVQLKADGSLRDFPNGFYPHEIAVCVPVSLRDEILAKVLGVINSNGGKVNRTCGLHVHLDMRGENQKKAFSNLVSSQKILYQMVPVSRRGNTYCAKTPNKDIEYYSRSSNRYYGINPQSFRKYGTIEVRLHSGTTDFSKITNFVDILTAVAYNEKEITRGASTVSGFVKQYKLSTKLEKYIEHRIELFKSDSQEEAA